MAVPDVRVRLSAEGVAEVVAALRRVAAETNRTGSGGAKAFGSMNSSLRSMAGLASSVAGALAAIGISRLVKDAADAAEQTQNLSQRFGESVENLSALDVALRRMGSSLPDAARGLTTLVQSTGDASRGVGDAADKFAALGLTSKQIEGFASQSLSERIETIAQAYARMPEGIQRTEAAIGVLGPRAAALTPLLQEIAEKGMGGLRDQARGLAGLLNEDVVNAAGAAGDAFDDLAIMTRGLSTQFVAGLAPGLVAGMSAVKGEVVAGTDAFRTLGEVVGKILGFLITGLSVAVDSVHTRLTTLAANIASLFRGVAAAVTGNFDEAGVHLEAIGLRREREESALAERSARAWNRFFNPEALTATAKIATDEGDALVRDTETRAKTRAAIENAAIDAELSKIRARLKVQSTAEEAAYEQGLVSLSNYYADRLRLTLEGIDAEIAAQNRRRAVILETEKDKGKALAETKKIDAEIARLELERDEATLQSKKDERAAIEALAEQEIALDKRIAELKGDHHREAMIALDEELAKAQEVFEKAPTVQNAKRLDALRAGLEAQIEFNERQIDAQRAMDDFESARSSISAEVDAGLISQNEGERRLLALEKERIETLRGIARAMLAAAEATGDDDKIAKAQRFVESVDSIGLAAQREEEFLKRFKATAEDALVDGFANFLSEGIRSARSFGEAIRNMVSGVVAALQNMIAQMIAARAIGALFGLFTSGASAAGSAGIPGEVGPVYAAEGGMISGPGGPTSDAVPAMLSAGEYVVRASAVAQPGVASLLDSINAGGVAPSSIRRGVRGFAAGGLVGGGAASSLDGTLTVGLEDGLVLRALDTPAGQKVVLRAVAKNRRSVRRVLGG